MAEITTRILKNELVDIDKLVPFQGEAKKLSDQNFNRLRKVILEEGFSFTVHVWQHGEKIFIIDGHQRCHVLKQLKKQGYTIPPINCAFVSASNFKEAKKLVLMSISQYGKLDRDGFLDWIGEDDFDFEDFDFPDFHMQIFNNPNFSPSAEDEQPRLDEKKLKTCPECGHEF